MRVWRGRGIVAAALIAGCGGDGDSGADSDTAPTSAACDGYDFAGAPVCEAWVFNTDGARSEHLFNGDGAGIETDVRGLSIEEDGGETFVVVDASGVPGYTIEITAEMFAALSSRPYADIDFRSEGLLVAAGDVVSFGEDIGYNSNTACEGTGGYGFWPPGPDCPQDVEKAFRLPAAPSPATEDCYTQSGGNGILVNGASIFNWSDTFSYENEGVWYNLASELEAYDVDVCGGHSAMGEYHNHGDSPCLREQVGDDGGGHSPVYGFMADGYPLYGPWHADGVAAESCWRTRDYDDPDSETGCGEAGARTCLLVDPWDASAGTTPADAPGPDTDATVTSLSGNTFVAASGLYIEDYWYDAECAAQGGPYLDDHNGHDHDALGYHYHVTSGFPYNAGPLFYGALPEGGEVACSGSLYPEMMGGGGGGGGQPPSP